MSAAIVTAPLDVLKTRLQSDFYQSQLAASRAARGIPSIHTLSVSRSALLHICETFQILFAVPRVEGWRALFKGLGPNLVGVVPARAINFYTYGNGKRVISQQFNDGKETAWVHLFAAATAGIVTGTITSPIWVVKTRLQLDRSNAEKAGVPQARRYRSALDCTMQTIRHEGVRGLYRGLTASYLGVSESTMQWVLYEQMKMSLARRQERIAASGKPPSSWDQAISWTGKAGAAGIAKLFAAIITYPHEVCLDPSMRKQLPANIMQGCADATTSSTYGEWTLEVHWDHSVRQINLSTRGNRGVVRRTSPSYAEGGAERSHYVWCI